MKIEFRGCSAKYARCSERSNRRSERVVAAEEESRFSKDTRDISRLRARAARKNRESRRKLDTGLRPVLFFFFFLRTVFVPVLERSPDRSRTRWRFVNADSPFLKLVSNRTPFQNAGTSYRKYIETMRRFPETALSQGLPEHRE